MTDENKQIVDTIKDAKETLIAELGFNNASEEQKQQILQTLDQRVAITLTKTVLEKASDEEAKTIQEALENGGNIEEKVGEIVQNNPSLLEEIKKALEKLWEKVKKEAEAAIQ